MLSFTTNMPALSAARNLSGHYAGISDSIRRLSSGLRVGTSADDAAGLAIRELMRADITSMHQGVRNVNDAISMIQTADGALGVIDEKLIRMKELAEQAATGTYNSDQRLMIDSEFQAMADEIQRIATSTEFNGVKLIDGSREGAHNGSGMESTGEVKVHFGTGNDAAEDYYYVGMGDATLEGLGLTSGNGLAAIGEELGYFDSILGSYAVSGERKSFFSGIINLGVIPQGTKDFTFDIDDMTQNDTLQLFTVSGKHIAGTVLGGTGWVLNKDKGNIVSNGSQVVTQENGFAEGAVYDGSELNGTGGDVSFTPDEAGNSFTYNGMTIGYSGDGNPNHTGLGSESYEFLTIDEVTEDLILLVVGEGLFFVDDRSWEYMPPYNPERQGTGGPTISIETQDLAQKALEKIDEAILRKDAIRADLGAMQNRLENTATNLQIQAENLQTAESRISDVDVAEEMTALVRNQILTQSSTAMLSQANSMPNMLMSLLG